MAEEKAEPLGFWQMSMRGSIGISMVFTVAMIISFVIYGFERPVIGFFVGALIFFLGAGFCHTQDQREHDNQLLLTQTLAREQYNAQRAAGAPTRQPFSDFADDTGEQQERTPNP